MLYGGWKCAVSHILISSFKGGLFFLNILGPKEDTLMHDLKVGLGGFYIPGHHLYDILPFQMLFKVG